MRRIVISEYTTLDGSMDNPGDWSGPFWGDDIARLKFDELMAADSLLLGRRSYEAFAAVWPTFTDDQGFAAKVNAMPKHVVTGSTEPLTWNATAVTTNDIKALRDGDGGDVLVWGSATLVQHLLATGTYDVLRVLQYPLALGRGPYVFAEPTPASYTLAQHRTFASGAVCLDYVPSV